MLPSNVKLLRSDNNIPYYIVPQKLILHNCRHKIISISLNELFSIISIIIRKYMFSINKNTAIRKPTNSNIKPSINYEILS